MKLSNGARLGAATVLLFGLAACGSNEQEAASGASGSAPDTATASTAASAAATSTAECTALEPFPIGIATSLTEPGAYQLGQEASAAIKSFVDVQNASGSPVTFDIIGEEDDQGDPTVGREAVARLLEKGAKAIVGDMSSAISTATQPVVMQNGAIMMVGGSWADELTDPANPLAFRVGASNSGQATHGIVPYLISLRDEKGIKSVGLLTEDSPYGKGMADSLISLMKEKAPDLTVTNEVYPADATDVTPQLLALKEANPDEVVIIAVGAARNLAIPQAFEVGLAPDAELLAQWNWPTYSDYWEVVGDKGTEVPYIDFEAPDQPLTEQGQALADATGARPSIWAQWAWDGMLALTTAIESACSTDPTAVATAMESISVDGASGQISFSKEEADFHDRQALPTFVMKFDKLGDGAADAKVLFSTTG
ncbi:MAG: ABC transporter substrate-binding protein [Actinomycetota bacterium]|nr:ABC transporter substrate-binding protein [Actinomycetota bacterium]